MNNSCIFCSAHLGSNNVLERFPVGTSVAFDPNTGRIWAVCHSCARWNLAPIEERWEAVESAERAFRQTTRREQWGPIGLAESSGGTRLIRIGSLDAGTLAIWRYGRRLLSRRIRHHAKAAMEKTAFFTVGVVSAGLLIPAALVGLPLAIALPAAAVAGAGTTVPFRLWRRQAAYRILALTEQPTGKGGPRRSVITVADAIGALLRLGREGGISVVLETAPLEMLRRQFRWSFGVEMIKEDIILEGEEARRFLMRLMAIVNRRGASEAQLREALQIVSSRGGSESFISETATTGMALGPFGYPRPPDAAPLLPASERVALELALNEESEREAIHSEMKALRDAWKEAQRIATIADSL